MIDNLVSLQSALTNLEDSMSNQLYPLLLRLGALYSSRGESSVDLNNRSLCSLALEGLIGDSQFKLIDDACASVMSHLNRCEERFEICHLLTNKENYTDIVQKSTFSRVKYTSGRLSYLTKIVYPAPTEVAASDGAEGTQEPSMSWYLAGIKNFIERYKYLLLTGR
jgi:hypothetical protein